MDSLVSAYGRLDDTARAWLRRQGVSTETMLSWPGPIGVADIEVHALGLFDFAAAGARALVHPVYSAGIYSEIVDVAAWLPSDPSRWWTLQYSGWAIGDDQLLVAETLQTPIVLHPHPLAWLAAGGEGMVVNDWAMSSPALRSVPAIITDDPVFGREVERRLTMPVRTCPPIRVRVRAAA